MLWSPRDRYISYTESMDAPEEAEVKVRKEKGKWNYLLSYIPQMRILFCFAVVRNRWAPRGRVSDTEQT